MVSSYRIHLVSIATMIIGASALHNVYTEGNWYTHFKDLNCSGHEDNIFDCPYDRHTDSSCSNHDDASVICQCKIFNYQKLFL